MPPELATDGAVGLVNGCPVTGQIDWAKAGRFLEWRQLPKAVRSYINRSNGNCQSYITKDRKTLTLPTIACCPICSRSGLAHKDHNHLTGKMRETICGRCNQAIGLLADNPEFARAIARYLEKHNG